MAVFGSKHFSYRLISHLKVNRGSLRSFYNSKSAQNNQTNDQVDTNETDFGYERVSFEEKAKRVNTVFSNVAQNYDLMNDVMSGGTHRLFKDIFMSTLDPQSGTELIDVAGGTGDIAFRFLKATNDGTSENRSQVTVCDINNEMLKEGTKRATELGLNERSISWVQGNAESLPFKDFKFDAYTIAFGIRNVPRKDSALKEAFRVLKKGGRFLCLEFSHVDNSVLRELYDLYSFQVIPVMGQVLARDWKSYQYLVESIRNFPKQEEFKEMIENAGFKETFYKNIFGGICTIHSGFKI